MTYVYKAYIFNIYDCPAGCRIYKLLLCRGVWPSPTSVLDITLNNLIDCSNTGALGNAEYSFIVIAPGPLWHGVVAPDRALSISQIELNYVLMLN